MKEMYFDVDGRARWARMGDFCLHAPDGRHTIEIRYVGGPPHGDSYHRATVDGRALPGYAWGCMFAFSSCSRYAAFSWMPTLFARHTIVVDMQEAKFTVLPEYVYDFVLEWPLLQGAGRQSGAVYAFDGAEVWQRF